LVIVSYTIDLLVDNVFNLTDGFIPNLIFLCMKYILTKGIFLFSEIDCFFSYLAIKEVGILRISGSSEGVKLMKQKVDIARKFTW
jgi:hypothetical protein